MDQVCGEVCTGRVRDGQPQYDQLPGGGRSTLTTDHSNDKLFIFRNYSFNSDQCFIKAEFAIANLCKSTCMCLPVG